MDGDDLYPNAWYRETAYQDGDVTFVELQKISDDLETDIRLIYQSERSGGTSDTYSNLTYGLNKEIESRGGDTSDYNCNYQEQITYTENDNSYELVNLTSYTGSSNALDDCAFESFTESSQSRYVFGMKSILNSTLRAHSLLLTMRLPSNSYLVGLTTNRILIT